MPLSKCRASIAFLVPVCFPYSPPPRFRKPTFINLSVRIQVAKKKSTANPATVMAPTSFGEHEQNFQQGQSGAQLIPRNIYAQVAQRAASNQSSRSQLRWYSGQSALGGYDEAWTQTRARDPEQLREERDSYLTTVSSSCVVSVT